MRNYIISKAAVPRYSDTALKNHPFLQIFHANTGGKDVHLVKLLVDCSEQLFYTKMTLPRWYFWIHSENFPKTLISLNGEINIFREKVRCLWCLISISSPAPLEPYFSISSYFFAYNNILISIKSDVVLNPGTCQQKN